MAERQESKKNLEQTQPETMKRKQEAGPESQAIKTWEAGLVPGQESLKANSRSGEVGVARLRPGEIIENKVNQISAQEQAVLDQISPDNLVASTGFIKETIASETAETADIDQVTALFDDNMVKILRIIDLGGLNEPNIPRQGEHFLVTQEDSQLIRDELEKLGYANKMIPGATSGEEIGFVAEKQGQKPFVFVFSLEDNAPQEEQQKQAA